MDRGAWQATVHGVIRVRYDLATKPPPPYTSTSSISKLNPFLWGRKESDTTEHARMECLKNAYAICTLCRHCYALSQWFLTCLHISIT